MKPDQSNQLKPFSREPISADIVEWRGKHSTKRFPDTGPRNRGDGRFPAGRLYRRGRGKSEIQVSAARTHAVSQLTNCNNRPVCQ